MADSQSGSLLLLLCPSAPWLRDGHEALKWPFCPRRDRLLPICTIQSENEDISARSQSGRPNQTRIQSVHCVRADCSIFTLRFLRGRDPNARSGYYPSFLTRCGQCRTRRGNDGGEPVDAHSLDSIDSRTKRTALPRDRLSHC